MEPMTEYKTAAAALDKLVRTRKTLDECKNLSQGRNTVGDFVIYFYHYYVNLFWLWYKSHVIICHLLSDSLWCIGSPSEYEMLYERVKSS